MLHHFAVMVRMPLHPKALQIYLKILAQTSPYLLEQNKQSPETEKPWKQGTYIIHEHCEIQAAVLNETVCWLCCSTFIHNNNNNNMLFCSPSLGKVMGRARCITGVATSKTNDRLLGTLERKSVCKLGQAGCFHSSTNDVHLLQTNTSVTQQLYTHLSVTGRRRAVIMERRYLAVAPLSAAHLLGQIDWFLGSLILKTGYWSEIWYIINMLLLLCTGCTLSHHRPQLCSPSNPIIQTLWFYRHAVGVTSGKKHWKINWLHEYLFKDLTL